MAGEADGWGTKTFQAIFLPLMILGMYLLFKFLPRVDPKRKNYPNFATAYKVIQMAIIAFFVILFIATSFINLGYQISVSWLVTNIIGLMFIVIGNYFGKIRNNYFVGIKTPWTLANEEVWNKTQQEYRLCVALQVMNKHCQQQSKHVNLQLRLCIDRLNNQQHKLMHKEP
jgi:uncharacterized membrane protein